MSPRALRWLLASSLLAAGCASPAAVPVVTGPPRDPEWVRSGHHPSLAQAHVEAVGVGPDADAARASAVVALRERIFGAEPLAAGAALPQVHRDGVDPAFEARLGEGGVAVLLAVPRERVEAVLRELEAGVPSPEGVSEEASPLSRALRAADATVRARFACERRRALFQEDCALPDLEPVLAPIRTNAASLRVALVHADGLPLDEQHRPLAPLLVRVSSRDEAGRERPVPGIPLRLRGDEEGAVFVELSATTDASGLARFAPRPSSELPSALSVEVDIERLFGSLASALPAERAGVPVRGRRRGVTRAAFHLVGSAGRDPRVAAGLRRAFARASGAVLRLVDEEGARPLLAASDEERAEALRALAERLEGRIDVIVLGEVHSEFASRMGENSVWYEARFRGEVYDVWTGATLAVLEVQATASGLGDSRADQAARAALAERIVERLFALGPPAPEPAAAPQASR